MTMPGKYARILALALCLGLAFSTVAFAQDWGRLMTPTQPLNVRKERDRKSAKVATLKPGQVVRVDFLKDDWYAVFDPDETERDEAKALGYSKADYLRPVQSAQWGEIRVVEPKMLNVRKGRGPKFEHAKTLYAGDLVKIDFPRDGWVAVFEPDARERKESKAIGYANARFLVKPSPKQLAKLPKASEVKPPEAKAPEIEAPEAEPTPVPAAADSDWGMLVRLTDNAKIRQTPDTEGTLLVTMVRGDLLKVYGRNGDWLRAYMPQERTPSPAAALGWVHKDLLDLSEDELAGQPRAEPLAAASTEEAEEPEPAEPVAEPAALVEEPAVEPVAEPVEDMATAAETFAAAPQQAEREEHVLVVPKEVGGEPSHGIEPVADQEAHGFRYALLSVKGQDPLVKFMEIRVWVDVTVVPDSEDLRDLATTIWIREGNQGKQGVVSIYLPGQDLNNLSYAQGRFGPRGPAEFWTRETTLYGTRFK